MSILTHVNAATSDQQTRDNLKRHSYSRNSAMGSIATEVGKLVTNDQLEQTWGDSFARTVNGTSHGFAKRQANQEDLTYILPALAAIAVKNPKRDMWAELSRGTFSTPEQQEHILNVYTIISLFQRLNENGLLSQGAIEQDIYDEMFGYQLTEALDETFHKFGNDSLRAKVTLFVTHIFPFVRYIPAIPEPSNLSIHYANIHDFHKSFNPHAARSFASHQPATEDVAMDPASQVRAFKFGWEAYRKNTLELLINRDPTVNGYRTIFLRQPRDGKGDAAYYSSRISAELWKVKGKGDCGFDAVGVPRETFVHEVLSRWDTDPELRHAMKNDFKGFLVEWRYQKDPQDRRFFSKKLTDLIEKESIDVLTDHGNDADSVDNMPDADAKEFIIAYYLEKGDFSNATARAENNGDGFITSSQAQDAGDHNASAVWRPEAGALRTLAKTRGVNLRLWKRVDDKSRPAKFAQKRDIDFKILYQNMTEEELGQKIAQTDYSESDLEKIRKARSAPKVSQKELDDLTEELELSAYPWSYVEIDRKLPTLHILNGGNHYDVILPEGDIEEFPHAFYNEIKSSKTSHPEWFDEIDRTVADLFVQYPFVKQLMDRHPPRIAPAQKHVTAAALDFGDLFKQSHGPSDISDIFNQEELVRFNARLTDEAISGSSLATAIGTAWSGAKGGILSETSKSRLEAYAKAYLSEMEI